MGIHQQVNHKTVRPEDLPSLTTARHLMQLVHGRALELAQAEDRVNGTAYCSWADFWINSTRTAGIRTARVRLMHYDKNADDTMPRKHNDQLRDWAQEILKSWPGCFKIYEQNRIIMKGDVGYAQYYGPQLIVTLYYRSNQLGR